MKYRYRQTIFWFGRSDKMEWLECITKLRHQLHEIPETSMQEKKTKELLMQFLRTHTTWTVVDRGAWFYALKKAEATGVQGPVAFRADMDAVSGGDGMPGHYCGHDGHCSILCGLALYLDRQNRADRDVYLIFQPAEEIGKGAQLCCTLIQEMGIEEVYGLHNIPGYPLRQILVRSNTFACASTGLSIRMTGVPSHAAYPEAGRNPALVLARLLLEMERCTQEMSRQKGFVKMTVIGMEIGSANYGVSASDGVLRVTVRAESQEMFDSYLTKLEALANRFASEAGLSCHIEEIERFPATENHESSVKKIRDCAGKLQLDVAELEEPMRWSEDFGYYLQMTKGAFFGIGDGIQYPQLHTAQFEFPDAILQTGVVMLAGLI